MFFQVRTYPIILSFLMSLLFTREGAGSTSVTNVAEADADTDTQPPTVTELRSSITRFLKTRSTRSRSRSPPPASVPVPPLRFEPVPPLEYTCTYFECEANIVAKAKDA